MRSRLALLLALGLLVMTLRLVGQSNPRYAVVPPQDQFSAGGRVWTAGEAARKFAPLLQGENARRCWFEALPAAAPLFRVLYRFEWPDETHPQSTADSLYRRFRTLWFGSPADVEYVWLEADLKKGEVSRIAFERGDVGRLFVGHIPVTLDRGQFPLDSERPVLRVATWNHLFETGAAGPAAPSELKYLDDASFERLRIGRRSQPPLELLTDPG